MDQWEVPREGLGHMEAKAMGGSHVDKGANDSASMDEIVAIVMISWRHQG